MRRLLEKIENVTINFSGWLAAFAGVVVIRFLFETFSSPAAAFPAAPDVPTMVHYFLFFIGAFISCALIIRIFVPDIARITKVLIFVSPILWLPPIIDLIHSGGSGYTISYIFAGGAALWHAFISFGGVSPFGGVSLGIRTELILILLGMIGYIFLKTKSFWKSLGVAILGYILIFLWLIIPSILAFLAAGFSATASMSSSQILNVVTGLFINSHIVSQVIRPIEQINYQYGIDIVLNAGLSHVLYIIDSIIAGLWFYFFSPVAFRAILKNIRPGRAIHFCFMILVGVGAAVWLGGGGLANWFDVVIILTTLIAFLSGWLFAVGTNDAVDLAIDQVSNPDRPLVTGMLSQSVLRQTNTFFFIWALVGAFIAGYWTIFVMLVFIAAYYIYSIPPLRLKRVPILATFLIALASLSAVMTGFYLFSTGKFIGDFPKQLALIVLVFFTLCTNIKDIKDVHGDHEAGIMTIPSVFGERTGRMIIGLLFALSFVLIGLISHSSVILIISLIAAALGYCAVAVGKFREWRSFLLYFIYAVAIVVLFLTHIA